MMLLPIRVVAKVEGRAFIAINWLQFSYKIVIKGYPEFVKKKQKSYKIVKI
jgi:hypothetical protein